MNFYPVSDLHTSSANMWATLKSGNEVVLTDGGKPSALMIDIPEGSFEETLRAVRQAKAIIALNNMRARAAKKGYLSDEQIESLIAEARSGN